MNESYARAPGPPSDASRYLAIDLGERRTGLAVGDEATGVVSPRSVIETRAPAERMRRIGAAIEAEAPGALVLGLPRLAGGREGPAAARVRAFAAELAGATGLPVHLVDERYSSEAADEKMARSGLTHGGKKKRRDALAAAAILERFLAG